MVAKVTRTATLRDTVTERPSDLNGASTIRWQGRRNIYGRAIPEGPDTNPRFGKAAWRRVGAGDIPLV